MKYLNPIRNIRKRVVIIRWAIGITLTEVITLTLLLLYLDHLCWLLFYDSFSYISYGIKVLHTFNLFYGFFCRLLEDIVLLFFWKRQRHMRLRLVFLQTFFLSFYNICIILHHLCDYLSYRFANFRSDLFPFLWCEGMVFMFEVSIYPNWTLNSIAKWNVSKHKGSSSCFLKVSHFE